MFSHPFADIRDTLIYVISIVIIHYYGCYECSGAMHQRIVPKRYVRGVAASAAGSEEVKGQTKPEGTKRFIPENSPSYIQHFCGYGAVFDA